LGDTADIASMAHVDWHGRRVLVVGLGRFGGGVGVTRWLVARGARVTVTDQAEAGSLEESLKALAGAPVAFVLGGHEACDLKHIDLAVINPAVDKRRSALFRELVRLGVPWTTEVNLFCERCPAKVIGVTGSYGKSTTCAMLTGVLERALLCGWDRFSRVYLGGNFGGSLLPRLGQMTSGDVVVMELSNTQLEDVTRIGWTPDWAVITNLHPHHLDRYDAVTDYYAAKLNMIRDVAPGQPVVVGDLHDEAEALLRACTAKRPDDVHRVPSDTPPIELDVPGRHNQANARCVLKMTELLGIDEATVRVALASFSGLPHRLEPVGRRGGVRFINDSKSTSPDATRASIEAIEGPVICVVGGTDKSDVDYTQCAHTLAGRCRVVVSFGESSARWAEALRARSTPAGGEALIVESCECLADAVAAATRIARDGDTVLFSPGAPSFDAYANFAERGEHFRVLLQ